MAPPTLVRQTFRLQTCVYDPNRGTGPYAATKLGLPCLSLATNDTHVTVINHLVDNLIATDLQVEDADIKRKVRKVMKGEIDSGEEEEPSVKKTSRKT